MTGISIIEVVFISLLLCWFEMKECLDITVHVMADYLTYIVTIATNQPAFEFEESKSEWAWKFLRRLNDNKFVPDTDKELFYSIQGE